MKNKSKLIITLLFLYFSIMNAFAIEDFSFESKSIEIIDNNIVFAKDGVKVVASDGLNLSADEAKYNRNTKILQLQNNITIIDQVRIKIYGNNIVYNKILEKITSDSKTEINIDNSHQIFSEDILFRGKFYNTIK